MRCLAGVLLLMVMSVSAAQPGGEVPRPVTAPDADIRTLQWNRYTTENFTLLALDDAQGRYLYENVEKAKSWVFGRWGLPDVKFVRECRVLVVHDRALMKKLFGLDESRVEARRDMIVVWLVSDDRFSRTAPGPLTEVCLCELEHRTGAKLGWWFHRGAAGLNGPLSDIRADLAALNPLVKGNHPVYGVDALLTMTEAKYKGEPPERRLLFDRQAVALCLLVRKEFGQVRTHEMAGGSDDPEQTLQKVLGFRDFDHFNRTFRRYMLDLSGDVVANRTPDSYLDIQPLRR
jgi:hypothetical protein